MRRGVVGEIEVVGAIKKRWKVCVSEEWDRKSDIDEDRKSDIEWDLVVETGRMR